MENLDILLVIAPPFFIKMPHIGVAYLCSYLKSKGFKPSVCDLSLKLHNSASGELKRFWGIDCVNSFFQSEISDAIFKNFENEIDNFVEDFLKTGTKVIGFSVNLISIYLANRIAEKVKSRDPNRLVIFGGQGTFSRHPRDEIIPTFADIYVIGEGETVLHKVLDSYYSGRRINNGPGVLLGSDLGLRQPLPAPQVNNLGEFPFPRFAEFDLREYNQGSDYKPLPMLLSRGCVRRCTYCIDYLMWPKYRFRPPELVMDEMRYHVESNKTNAFEFIDLTCNGNLNQISRLSDLIIESGLKFSWVSYAIIRSDMDSALLSKMKKAGCHTLIYGVESGSDNVLKLMGKGYTAKQASEVIKLSHNAGICTNVNIIVGFPGETEDDFNQTVEFIKQNKEYINEVTNVSGCTLFPTAEIGMSKAKYGVYLDEGADPMLFYDSNGLDREGRHMRVAELMKIIADFKLSKAIINKPTLNPKVKLMLEADGHEENN